MTKTDYCVIVTTTDTKQEAKRIAAALLETKLAACVQLLPIDSHYIWKGEITESTEILLLIKTRKDLFSDIQTLISKIHSYETPELIQLDIGAGMPEYLNWIRDNTKGIE